MSTIAELADLLDAARADGRTVGLVPTMGALHEGHLSLVRRAAAECDLIVATLFVNPLQFGAGDDLAAYPRDLDRDTDLAAAAGADLWFTPTVAEMYPEPVRTTVAVAGVGDGMEGAARPTHFAGVATVVAKLFAIAGRCRAYFGEKDYQQLVVVRRMAADLSFPVEVVGCATVRDHDGLALSSRNAYLGAAERDAAPVLHRALRAGAAAVLAGERDPAAVTDLVGAIVEAEPLAELDYAEIRHAATLEPVETLNGELRLLVAARFGATRLLDNLSVRP